MIKTILDWIFGKKDSEVKPAETQAPYKVEAPAPIVETAPVTVKAKYKKADLNKMTKKDLLDLVAKHGLEVKSRATKEELIKVLSKV